MRPLPCPIRFAPRVYTIPRPATIWVTTRTRPLALVTSALVGMVLAVALTGASATAAQIHLTVTPAMTKGPVSAPVVIVEFSDYQ